jgi:hypothetical protein
MLSCTRNVLLCEYAFMRTTIELPDPIFRRLKATAAMRGMTIKKLVGMAVERELALVPLPKKRRGREPKLPLIKGAGHVIRPLTGHEMDELLFG